MHSKINSFLCFGIEAQRFTQIAPFLSGYLLEAGTSVERLWVF